MLSWLSILGPVALVACGDASKTPQTPSSSASDMVIVEATLSVDENPNNTLSALVTVETPEEATVRIAFTSDDTAEQLTGASEPGTLHELVVVGMRANTLYSLVPIVTYTSGASGRTAAAQFETGRRPSGLPEMTVTVTDAAAVQPGITIFGTANEMPADQQAPEFIGLDTDGEVVWYYDDPEATWQSPDRDLKLMHDGNLLLKTEAGLRVITLAGDTVVDLQSEQIGLAMHHDVTMLPNGNFAALVQAPRAIFIEGLGDITQMGDGVIEVTPDGEVIWDWWTFDHIPADRFPTRLSLESDGEFFDWTHANSVAYVASEDALLVSLRHQDWVLSIDRGTGGLNWRAGRDGDFALEAGEWFSGQHNAYLTADGQLSVYDNGNERESGEEYSRGVTYQLDTSTMTARETFSYTVEPFTPFVGGHRILDNGNSFLCAGGIFDGPAEIVEVSALSGEAVWALEVERSVIYRAQRLPSFWHDSPVP